MGNMCAEVKEKMTFCAGSVVENPAIQIEQVLCIALDFHYICTIFPKGHI